MSEFGFYDSHIFKFELLKKVLNRRKIPVVTRYNEFQLAKGNYVFEHLQWSNDLDEYEHLNSDDPLVSGML